MYLKALEMQGFKSFPDKTVLQFGSGVTAVVGPNGSGKSNIADAVKWVLGEQSTKSLRGSKMEDVIFSGTTERRPQGFAEVTLKLDNADGALNNSEAEVSVTRRYYRSGESSYMINGQNVRLKDVHELFMDTGLGRDGYSMVGQGKIEEMVAAKSDNRRDMFEEAAGISHFRYRRAESVKRLEQAEENLVRLRDIVSELAARVGPLEKQSKKAQQFLVYAEERKGLEIALWLSLLDRSAEQIRELRGNITVAQGQYDMAGQALLKLSSDIDAATYGTRDINIKTEQLRSSIQQLEEQSSQLEAQAAVYENTVKHNAETIERIQRDCEMQTSEKDGLNSELNDVNEQIASLDKLTEQSKQQLELLSQKLTGLISRDEEYSDEYNAINTVISALQLKISQTDIMLGSSASSVQELLSHNGSIDSGIEMRAAEKQELTTLHKAAVQDVKSAEEKLNELNNMAQGFSLRAKKAAEKAENRKSEYEELRLKLLSKQQRLKFLEDTEKNMEGYGGSVKAVMREKTRGTLGGIHGTLLQLINVREEYSTAIETALGNAIQDIVTDSENDAKRAMNFLKESNGGRATFLPLSAIRGRVLNETGLDDCFGFVNLACELVNADKQYEGVIKDLLGRIAVCEDIDCAIAMAKKYQYKFKTVTLDGQVINAGGSMTGGSKVSNSGFLARRTEIEKLKTECTKLENDSIIAASALKTANEALGKENADLEGARAEIMQQTEVKAGCESALNLCEAKIKENTRLCDELSAEKAASQDRIDYFNKNINIAEQEKQKLAAEMKEQQQRLTSLTGGRDSLMSERESINGQMAEVNLSIVAYMKERQGRCEAAESLNRRMLLLGERRTELENELNELDKKNEALNESAEKTKASAVLLRSEISNSTDEISRLISEREKCEKTIADSRDAEKSKTEEREKLGSELVRLQERKHFLEKEQEETEHKLYEEYQLTRREAADCAIEIESVAKAQKRLAELKNSIKALGSVNVAAIDEYKEVSSRYEFLSSQVEDVEKSKKELLKMIDELTTQMSERFKDRFEAINRGFSETFTQLFSGGTAELILEDETDILECGIDIKAQPPGKNVKSLSLLSGGEKGLTAIALLFAILKERPAPFCIFDEVEAALDDVNVLRYAQYVRMMTDDTQFILITHRRGTMEEADILYGVTMQERGVSKLLELKTAEMVAELKLDDE